MIKYLVLLHLICVIIFLITCSIKKIFPDSIICFVPFIGIYSSILLTFIMLSNKSPVLNGILYELNRKELEQQELKKRQTMSKEEKALNSKFMIYIPSIYNFLSQKQRGFSQYSEILEYMKSEEINMYSVSNKLMSHIYPTYGRTPSSLMNQFAVVLKYTLQLKDYPAISSIYDNMLETLGTICQKDTMLTNDLYIEILKLLKTYADTFQQLIDAADEKRKEELQKKAETQNAYLIPKIDRINDVLKDIQSGIK